jgi:hypothetical protein
MVQGENMKTIWNYITYPYRRIKEHFAFKKRMKALREQDPFIYK